MDRYNPHNKKRIGIYRELAIVIVMSIIIAVAFSLCTFLICRRYGVMVDVQEDYSNYKKKYDIQVMSMVRELDSALSTAVEEISASGDSEESTISDAMKYLLKNDRLPFAGNNDITITITNRSGLILWKSSEDSAQYKYNRVYVNVEELVANSYDDCSEDYSFVYTKSISKNLYYIIFESHATPEYIYNDFKLKSLCIALAAGIFIILVLFISKIRIDYVRYLSGVVDEISKGNLNTPVDKKGMDELTVIAESIDDMQHNLDRMIKDERENDRRNMELITNLSHDIKTPMTIITGYLDVVISKKYESDTQRDTYIKKAFQQVEKINVMIHKIFVLAKNESGYSSDNIQRCNISLMLQQDISEFEGIALQEQRKFDVHIPDKALYIDVVVEQIREVLDNVLMNAVKYSRKESTINVCMREEESTVLITVTNETEGVKKLDCERIFDKFYREDQARNSSVAGNGLGLSIVRETVERYGGKVWAEYNQGIFRISIRMNKA